MKYEDVIVVYNEMKRLLKEEENVRLLYRLQNLAIFLTNHYPAIHTNNPEFIRDFFNENELYYRVYPEIFDDSDEYTKWYIKLFEIYTFEHFTPLKI
jgi:hypothetical protein